MECLNLILISRLQLILTPQGVTIILILQISTIPTNTIFYWDFGDGNNSTLENPTHQYLNPAFT